MNPSPIECGLTQHHAFIWTTLQALEVGERIKGPDLMNRASINDKRLLYQLIKDLRKNGFLVGAIKDASGGYFEIRDINDLNRTIGSLRKSGSDLLQTAHDMEMTFYKKELEK